MVVHVEMPSVIANEWRIPTARAAMTVLLINKHFKV